MGKIYIYIYSGRHLKKMAIKQSSEFLRLGVFSVILDTILNSKMQNYLLLQVVSPKIINALDYTTSLY